MFGPGPAFPKLYDFNSGFVALLSFEFTIFNDGMYSSSFLLLAFPEAF